MDGEVFGRTEEGETVQRFSIPGGGLTANIMTWGASLQNLAFEGHDAPLVLGYEEFEDYPAILALSGRHGRTLCQSHPRRQVHARGKRFQADNNFLGRHMLHGGAKGFAKRVWDVALHGSDYVTLSLHSSDGDMGFPGAVDVTCTYRLKIPTSLAIEFTATADEPTLCNLAHHSYFNLDDGGSGDILDHRLMINAAAYLPVDDEKIPTGVVLPVDGTAFDFRRARKIRMESKANNFPTITISASPPRGVLSIRLPGCKVLSPGLKWRSGQPNPGCNSMPATGRSRATPMALAGAVTEPYAGLCLEPQVWPDSPNRPYFPQAVLLPGELYRQTTEYRFKLA